MNEHTRVIMRLETPGKTKKLWVGIDETDFNKIGILKPGKLIRLNCFSSIFQKNLSYVVKPYYRKMIGEDLVIYAITIKEEGEKK